MTQHWYYTTDGRTHVGPVTTSELKRLARSGTLAPTDLVQMAGVPKWLPAAKVKGLFDAATPIAGPHPANMPRPEPVPPEREASTPQPVVAATAARPTTTGYEGEVARHEVAASHRRNRAMVGWGGLSLKAKLGVAAGAATAALMMSCAGFAVFAALLKSGGRTPEPSTATFSDADYAADFSNTDYSVRAVDYTKGPQGQPLVVREGVYPDYPTLMQQAFNQAMIDKSKSSVDDAKTLESEAKKVFKESGFKNDSGVFRRHGVRTLWYPDSLGAKASDKKFVEEVWCDGKLHGPLASFDEIGRRRLERTYRDDLPHGKETIWDEKGRVKIEFYNAAGKKHGVFKEFYPNGKTHMEGAYKDGGQHGKWLYWHEDGSRSAEEYFVGGEKHGQFTGWHLNGQKSFGATFVRGKQHGKRNEWHPNGQVSLEATFVNDKKVGTHTEWHTNGQKSKEFDSKDGLAQGTYTEWHLNGQKANEGRFKNGKEEGEWWKWRPNGDKLLQTQFRDGKVDPVETEWYDAETGGNESYIRSYKNGLKIHEYRFYPAISPDHTLTAKAQKIIRVGPGRKMHERSWSKHPANPNVAVPSGVWTDWNSDGTVSSIKRY